MKSDTVCYLSHADKAVRYPAETIPLIFMQAAAPSPFGRIKWSTLADLHEFLRGKAYVAEDGPCDRVQPIRETVFSGGDCEDWAAVLINQLKARGVPVLLVTAGDSKDNFRHVYVLAQSAGQWRTLDPKGSPRGSGFDVEPNFPIKRYWTARGEVADPRLSGSSGVRDGGATVDNDDLLFATSSEFGPWSEGHPAEAKRILDELALRQRAAASLPQANLRGDSKTVANTLKQRQQQLDAAIAVERQKAAPVEAMPMRPVAPVADPRDALTKDNDAVAVWVAGGMPWSVTDPVTGEAAGLQPFLKAAGFDMSLPETELREAAAQYLSLMFTNMKLSMRAEFKKAGYDVPVGSGRSGDGNGDGAGDPDCGCGCGGSGRCAPSGSGANFFDKLGKSATKLVKRPADFFQSLGEEIGKGFKGLGEKVLSIGDKVGWLSKYVLDPLMINAQAQSWIEVGNMLEGHSISDFNEKAFLLKNAQAFGTLGQYCLLASSVLQGFPPWGQILTVVGTVLVVSGRTINAVYADAEARRKQEAAYQAQLKAQDQQQAQQLVAPKMPTQLSPVKMPAQAFELQGPTPDGYYVADVPFSDGMATTVFAYDGTRMVPLARLVTAAPPENYAWQQVTE